MDTPNYRFINRHLIGIICDISDESPERAMPILQEALVKLRVSVDGYTMRDAEHWVEMTTQDLSIHGRMG